MNDAPWYINSLEKATSFIYSCLPSPRPSLSQLHSCKIIGHRGAHLGTTFVENTLPGFMALADCGVWGVELDIRWTKDLIPIISHDPDCKRLFKKSLVIAETEFKQLRSEVPQIPNLAEVVLHVGGKLHLMLEIKNDPYPRPQTQAIILQSTLANLTPVVDYHFLALKPELFEYVPFASLESQVIVGTFNAKETSQYAEQYEYGGLAGAYPFFTKKLRHKHSNLNQKIGTGHINTKRILSQEIAKGTDWIFSNRALTLQTWINSKS